jgi:hypothetical protein
MVGAIDARALRKRIGQLVLDLAAASCTSEASWHVLFTGASTQNRTGGDVVVMQKSTAFDGEYGDCSIRGSRCLL